MLTKGEKTREKITRSAAEVFHRKGFTATSISDLLKAADVKKGSLYFHFPGKDEIALAVLEQAERDFMDFLETALTGATPGARLDRFFRRALEWHRAKGFVGGCLFGNTALEASDSNSRYAARVDEVFSRWIEKIRTVIEAAQLSGEVRCNLQPQVLAQFVVSSLEGGIMLSRLRKEEGPLRLCLDSLVVFLGLKPLKEDEDAENSTA